MEMEDGDVGLDGVRVRPGARPKEVGLSEKDCRLDWHWDGKTKELTSESLWLPASLFLLWAGAGRLFQLEGALLLSGVDLCLRSVSKTDFPDGAEEGVCGGPMEDLRLPEE
jgi:hypothetical protein